MKKILIRGEGFGYGSREEICKNREKNILDILLSAGNKQVNLTSRTACENLTKKIMEVL